MYCAPSLTALKRGDVNRGDGNLGITPLERNGSERRITVATTQRARAEVTRLIAAQTPEQKAAREGVQREVAALATKESISFVEAAQLRNKLYREEWEAAHRSGWQAIDAALQKWGDIYERNLSFGRKKPWTSGELRPLLQKYLKMPDGGPASGKCINIRISNIMTHQRNNYRPLRGTGDIGTAVKLRRCAVSEEAGKDFLKAVAGMAVAAVGAHFLGTALMGSAGAATAAGSSAVAAAAPGAIAVPTLTPTVTAVVAGVPVTGTIATIGTAGAGAIASAIKQGAPMAEKVINTARTVDAVRRGDMPPPPISLGDGSLTDWAGAVGTEILQERMSRKISEDEALLFDAMIQEEQRRLSFYGRGGLSTNPNLPAELKQLQQEQAAKSANWLWVALPAAAALMMGG